MKPIGIYIHIPFCEAKCPYCNFYSQTDVALADEYTSALKKEIAHYSPPADSLYIGGGTPLLAGVYNLEQIIRLVDAKGEVTVEVNPNSTTREELKILRAAGVNRLSVGVQSFCDSELLRLGRRHTAAQAEEIVRAAYDVGFRNISCDLILGLGERGELERSLNVVGELPLTHVSAYILKVEEGTPFAERNICLTDEKAAGDYLYTRERLEGMGLTQYEISNFGLPSEHNLKYWHREEYLGFGAAAHSFLKAENSLLAKALRNSSDDSEKNAAAASGEFCHEADIARYIENPLAVTLLPKDVSPEKTEQMLRLRLREWTKTENAELVGQLVKAGYAEERGGEFRLTPRGFLVSNEIIGRLQKAIKQP